jgi:4-alpha-glucanotransferase
MSQRNEQELLNDLAERFGIASDYDDVWGHRHLVSDQTKRAILTAMGVRADTEDDVRRELAACADAPWRQPCDPVVVLRVGGGPDRWSFRMPAEEGEDQQVQILWEVRDEDGNLRQQGEAGRGLVPAETRIAEGRRHIRFELPVPSDLAIGYYDLMAYAKTSVRSIEGTLRLIVVPPHCYVSPHFHEGARTWGLSLQLYALRSSRNWGAGDFGDLAEFLEWAGKDLGAGIIGLNPLHALKNSRPYHISPYSPESRLYLNVLYLDVERIPEYEESEAAQRMLEDSGFRAGLEALRRSETVDYDQVYAAKRAVLEALFATFQERHLAGQERSLHPGTERGRAFEHYIREEGEALETFALFQALSEELRRLYPLVWVWQDWPEPYRHPKSAAVAAFRVTHESQVRFHQYLQWVANEQLGEVAGRARALGMPIGLYHDLALGSNRSGSDAWVYQDVLALGVDSGCPPDAFAPEGQNWGLPPVNPERLRASGYRMFIELLSKNLRHDGALRLDHVMGLFRLFWIPRGLPPSAGAYVRYPADDLLGIVALESVRHRAVIVGEDLGTVPDWIRERLADSRVLSYRVLYFERTHQGDWKTPGAYPQQAMAVVSTHDLPTLSGFWAAQDIEVRGKLGFYPDEAARQQALEERLREKARVLRALNAEGLLPQGLTEESAAAQGMTEALCRAIHAYLARTPSWVVLASLEDVLGEVAQINVPGTVDRYPNWSRKSSLSLEDLREDPRPDRLAAALRAIRPSTQG